MINGNSKAGRRPASSQTVQSQCVLTSLNEERSALGAALLDSQRATELLNHATPEDFTYEPYVLIFEVMKRLGPPLEISTLAGELERAGVFDRVGWDTLVHLEDGVIPELPMSSRLARLRNLRELRAIRTLLPEINALLHSPLSRSEEVIARIRQRLEEIETA